MKSDLLKVKKVTRFRELEPNSITGYSVKITTVFSSFDKMQIDKIVEACRVAIGDMKIEVIEEVDDADSN